MEELLNNYLNILNNINFNYLVITFISTLIILSIIKISTNFFKTNFIAFFIFSLPGTLAHELAHFLLGLILFAKPVGFSLIPKRTSETGFTMGSVNFTNINAINAIPIAIAPILLIPLGFIASIDILNYLSNHEFTIKYLLISIGLGLSIFSIFSSSIPSSQDFKVALSSKSGLILYTIIIVILLNLNKIKEVL